jgi:hypothetical protein
MQTISKVYGTYAHAEAAVRDLESVGVPASEISLVGYTDLYSDAISATVAGAELGAAVGGGVGLLSGLGVLAIPGVGPVVAVGWLAAAAAGAFAGSATGGIIGALVDAGTPETEAHIYTEVIRRGGTLVTVRTNRTTDQIKPILERHDPIDAAARLAEYQESGWKASILAPALQREQANREHARRDA